MRQIRQGTFETNSSSMHSISILKKGGQYTKEEIESGMWIFGDGVLEPSASDIVYGRTPFRILTTPNEKMEYAIASYGSYAKFKEIEEIMRRHVDRLKEIKIPTADRFHCNWHDSSDPNFYGDVDHESMGVLENFLNEHSVSLEDFIFDRRYIVWIDGDEYDIKGQMVDIGIIDKEKFEVL